MSRPHRDRLGRPIRARGGVCCVSCGVGIGVSNSRYGRVALKTPNPRCGACYLKWKASVRKAKGVL